MQLVHHGVTLQLPDDDPRVRVIETLLYGQPLPPPLPLPSRDAPSAEVPPAWRALWRVLTPVARRWLEQLARGPVWQHDVRRWLGVSPVGVHRHLSLRAREAGLAMPVHAKGRTGRRRWRLAPDAVGPVRALAAAERDAAAGLVRPGGTV